MRVAPPRHTPEFKSDALALLARTDRSLAEVAEDLGVNQWTLRYWYKKDQMAKRNKKAPASKAAAPKPPASESAEAKLTRLERENQRLRKEVDSLRMDREILKKAAAFFAKESE
jgi:transposase